jgi:sugar phosphate isomerase/epimerase
MMRAMQIGIFTKVFARPTLAEVLDAVAATGLKFVQFNMESTGLAPMPDEIPAELAKRIREETTARGLTIASVQGTFNMSHPEEEHRKMGLRQLRVIAEVCDTLGASNIAICIGTRDRENMWRHHPDNVTPEAWRDMTGCVREALRMAEDLGLTLALEPEVTNLVDSAKQARRLLDEMSSPHLKITMDAANLFHAGELPRMKEVLEEAFALLGRDIVLAHAKDILQDGEAGQEPAGKGLLDYPRYLALLKGCGFPGPLLLHGLPETEVPDCVGFLKGTLVGIP